MSAETDALFSRVLADPLLRGILPSFSSQNGAKSQPAGKEGFTPVLLKRPFPGATANEAPELRSQQADQKQPSAEHVSICSVLGPPELRDIAMNKAVLEGSAITLHIKRADGLTACAFVGISSHCICSTD